MVEIQRYTKLRYKIQMNKYMTHIAIQNRRSPQWRDVAFPEKEGHWEWDSNHKEMRHSKVKEVGRRRYSTQNEE